ncbi:hypothetical protein [Amycolatopsis aidingensis]|uniref:hypothetical protein n=1 Tax=Amycolatopsis aidingensis TaxID=2842453 RepID=UPI001C0D9AD5|nr:hypothetical protein [Amycolatopsis aidingensis]
MHTESRHDASLLRIQSTGHPLSSELVPTLAEPFQRGTERMRTDEHAGVGVIVTIRLPSTPQPSKTRSDLP